MQLFPAVLIGGPPHSGKSVLTYSLTQALRQRGVEHYVLRAYPDGEGDWANETDQVLVRRIRVKDVATRDWVQNVCRDIAHRHLPLIVDVGGRPTEWQQPILAECTHAVLLCPSDATTTDGTPAFTWWQELVERKGVPVLARLQSCIDQPGCLDSTHPILEGKMCDLHRGSTAGGPCFSALIELLSGLFAYSPAELRKAHVAAAPFDVVIELDRVAQVLGISNQPRTWAPSDLPRLLDYLPRDAPLALYDRGPNWVYAAMAVHNLAQPFHQFDVRLGWVQPPALNVGVPQDDRPVQAISFPQDDFTRLELLVRDGYLDYAEASETRLPPVPEARGLVVSGKLPLWFWTAIARTYAALPWLAVYQPQLGDQAVVVASKSPAHRPVGSLVRSPSPFVPA